MLMIPILASCGAKGPKEAILAGKFFNSEDTVVYVASKGTADTVYLDKNGKFKFKVMLDKPQLFSLNISRTQTLAYLAPGDSSYVEFDVTAQSDGPAFSADLKSVQKNILLRKSILQVFTSQWRSVFALEYNEFKSKLDTVELKLMTALDSISEDYREIYELEKLRIFFTIQNFLAKYPEYYSYVLGREKKVDSLNYYAFLDKINFNHEYLMFDEYVDLLNTYLQIKFEHQTNYNEISSYVSQKRVLTEFSFIDSLITNQTVRDYLKMSKLMEEIEYGEFYELTDIVQNYLNNCQTLKYKEKVSSKFCTKMILAPGKPAPVFRYSDINGKEYSLEDFRGNLVYIDFWATWCGPCRYELPYLKTLEKDYHSKKVVFVSISLDDNKSAWEKMVKEQDMKGVQLYGEGAWNSFVAKSYQIRGIPTFFLIDASGSILKPNAPRPSSDEIHSVLDENLLKL